MAVTTNAFAQKGRFSVRFTVKSLDCSTGKVVIRLDVKASHPDSTFLMGDANYRFDYDSRIITNPQIVSQENFASPAPASDTRYNPQNLNGTTEGPTIGTVSLNTTYGGSGTGAKLVGTDWITVSCLQFDIRNTSLITNNCFGLRWHTDTSFPVTGLSEVVLKNASSNVDAYVTKASGVFQNLEITSIGAICSGQGVASNGELMIPEGFSPNGDGLNDRFVLYNLGALKASVTIYNLSGATVYTSDNYQNDWDGKADGGTVPSGTYFYSVRLSDGRTFQRSMTISY
ncbi:hypothetical protein GCM10028809_12680 [Spirosoma gilvum]